MSGSSSTDEPLAAIVESAFVVRGVGTVLKLDFQSGYLAPEMRVLVELGGGGSRAVRVHQLAPRRAVDPEGRVRPSVMGIVVEGVSVDEVLPGSRLVEAADGA